MKQKIKKQVKNLGKNKKVVVAMSGGVDSSVAALLMKKAGYNVIGVFMKNWSDKKNLAVCNWKEDRKVAMKISAQLKIPLLSFDFEKEYRRIVVNEMFMLYKKGVTPNPDITCNEKVKFPLLLKIAKKLRADFIVTGHYARIKKTKKGYKLLRAKDESKDQSYFLYRLKREWLPKILFPIGDLKKTEVREIAKKNGFENYNRKSTTGICFIGKVNLKQFLQTRIKPKKGKILDPEGKIIGFHDGVYYYTIGQRLGPRLGILIEKGKEKKRWYVARKNVKKNLIIAAPEGHPLNLKKEFYLKKYYFINKSFFSELKKKKKANVLCRIRQVGELLDSKVLIERNKIKIVLKKPITGISDGQAAVIYKGKEVLGGGVISF
ncbi:MAG: tRNA-specific 2-thiouridylase MnmA [Candidatus Pacearchaeota archaeon]|nr:MAG: tRNA-specific 2-thiouridylase MnmA [Candidatus Pacearchaeota archaeon]